MSRIFIIWHDYDGNYMEEFDTTEKDRAEKRCVKLLERKDYGIQIDAVIQGKILTMKKVEVVSKVSLV